MHVNPWQTLTIFAPKSDSESLLHYRASLCKAVRVGHLSIRICADKVKSDSRHEIIYAYFSSATSAISIGKTLETPIKWQYDSASPMI
jgi:hypothetical protein